MRARIERHRARRGAAWDLVEEPLELARAVTAAATPERAVLVDCLTLWLANLMGAERDVDAATTALTAALGARRGPVALVGNEVGGGVVPMNALARRFVDANGRLHQALAEVATEVVMVTAGLPRMLKSATGRV